MHFVKKLLAVFLTCLVTTTFAAEQSFSSAGNKSIFIELFTSQGCSSCPPAEDYINKFSEVDELWTKYIPIVFHVDYWDYIGWKDVYAQPEFARRQYRYAKLKHVRTVYTPAFIVNGAGWRRGFFNAYPQVAGLDNGELNIKLDANKVAASFKANKIIDDILILNTAILGMDMVVNITAGENQGRKSLHNFVALGYARKLSETRSWSLVLPKLKKNSSKRYAFVAWLSRQNDPTPIQAVGGWLK